MKHFYLVFFLFVGGLLFAQKAQRSTIGSSGQSIQITAVDKTFYVSQSVGQQGVIGTLKNNGYVVIQGFQQPLFSKNKNQVITPLNALVYPNPVGEIINIKIQENVTTPITVAVYDVLGKLLFKEAKKETAVFSMDMTFLASGNYLFRLSANGKNQTYKLLKK